MLTGLPLGAMPFDTAEYMLGTVAVTPVLLESNGTLDLSTENWTNTEIDQVLQNVATGLQWWVDTLATFNTSHSLEFRIDDTYARTPVSTPYEPISRRSDSYTEYVGKFLVDQGYASSGLTLEDAMRTFNNDQRTKLGTDWSYTIFIVDSSADADGMFDLQGSFRQAFAFAGGLFFVTPSVRPASTYTHETGHMFWARDEYAGGSRWDEERGYYNSQNSNAVDGAPVGFVQQPSIMTAGLFLQQAYNTNTSAAATLAQIGWQDSDNDGIFDVLDVPLDLDVSARFISATETLEIKGTASAVPLLNQNSSGLKNDITLNRVSRIEYRIDGGNWIIASSPDTQVALLDLEISLPGTFSNVEVRAVDAATGITSNVVTVPRDRPTAGGTGWEGVVFLDANQNGVWDDDEALLTGALATIREPNGVFKGRLEPDDNAGSIYEEVQTGLRIKAVGNQVDGKVSAFAGTSSTGANNFHYSTLFGTWSDSWAYIKQQLQITLDQPTTSASIVAIGKGSNSVGRLEAYDVNGVLVARATSDALAVGQSQTLQVDDPQGRIKSIMAFGHAGTSVSLDDFRYGPATSATSNSFGTVVIEGVPDGQYTVDLLPPSSQFEIVYPDIKVNFSGGAAESTQIAAIRATSRWMNPTEPLDVNDNNVVQPLDALIVINDLNRHGPRSLANSDAAPPYLDVNGDLSITPIDALQIINFLNRQPSAPGGEGEAGGFAPGGAANAWQTGRSGAGGLQGEGELSGTLLNDSLGSLQALQSRDSVFASLSENGAQWLTSGCAAEIVSSGSMDPGNKKTKWLGVELELGPAQSEVTLGD